MGPTILFLGIGILAVVAWIARPRMPRTTHRESRAGQTNVRRVFSDIGALTWSRTHRYRKLSLLARTGVAMVCFERYCQAKGLRHPVIDEFVNHMWEVPRMTSLPDWESKDCVLFDFVRGGQKRDPLPTDFLKTLESAGIDEKAFEALVENCVEIFYCSAYGGTDHIESLRALDHVLRVTSTAGVTTPPLEPFLISPASQAHGWGKALSAEQRDGWRALVQAEGENR